MRAAFEKGQPLGGGLRDLGHEFASAQAEVSAVRRLSRLKGEAKSWQTCEIELSFRVQSPRCRLQPHCSRRLEKDFLVSSHMAFMALQT